MKTALTAALIAFTSPALACDQVIAHLGSYHTDDALIADVNETNPGLGCRLGAYEIGAYKNSFSDLTAYAIRDWSLVGRFGLFGGIASGYQDDVGVPDHGVTPIGGVAYRADAFTVRAAPSYNSVTSEKGVVLSLSINLGEIK